MKRVLLSLFATAAGLAALLGFKTHGQPVGATGALPSAGLPGSSPSSTSTSPSGTSPQPSGKPTSSGRSTTAAAPRTLDGDAVQTPYGVVQVQATVTGTRITNVKFLQLTANDGQSQQINSYAAPILLQETLTAQNANIDTVSGASYTTAGYVQSLQSALDQAGIR